MAGAPHYDVIKPSEQPEPAAAVVNGVLRKRTPVASKIALPIAAVIGTMDGSPPPSGCISRPRN